MRMMFNFWTMTLANSRSQELCLFKSETRMKDTNILLFEYLRKRSVDSFGIEVQAQLSDYQTPSGLQQSSVCTKKFKQIHHESFEIILFGARTYLGEKLQVVFDHLVRTLSRNRVGCRTQIHTSSELSDKVFNKAGKVPSSIARISKECKFSNYTCFPLGEYLFGGFLMQHDQPLQSSHPCLFVFAQELDCEFVYSGLVVKWIIFFRKCWNCLKNTHANGGYASR